MHIAALRESGHAHGLENFGTAALNAMRMEKGLKGTRELNSSATPRDAGIMRFVRYAEKSFVGSDAVRATLAREPSWACVYLAVNTRDADCHGAEAVLADGRVVGSISSAAFGPHVRQSLAFAYIEPRYAAPATRLDVMVLGEARPARVLAEAAYDPGNTRPRC